ncbi:MAG: FHA domain-containing protein, partial [Roseburia sp.]
TNSTNHTFVNGLMLASNVETELNHGDRIKLANEEFEFRTV